MPSPALLRGRCSVIGNIYVITSVTAGRRLTFTDVRCANALIAGLRDSDRSGISRSFAWMIMPDHLHWVMQLRAGTLARCVQSLKSRVAIAVNARCGEHRAVWQRGYYDHLVRSEEDVRRQAMYVMANPVRAGLASCLGEYPFAWCRWPLE
ncbi:transposase [Stenotrophomonas sp. Nf1]|nr:transposase [Stenotrophomonas sp. Nf1]PTA81089.1 transposase [Stenotrophomonas sp. Nf4]